MSALYDWRGRLIDTPVGVYGAAMPKALQWARWLQYNADRIEQSEGWARFLVAAVANLQQLFVTTARILRMKPNWQTDGWTTDEWRPVHEVAREKLAWFQQHKPRPEDMPPWAAFLVDAVEGAYIQQVRQADEVHRALDKGFVPVRIQPGHAGTDFPQAGVEEA